MRRTLMMLALATSAFAGGVAIAQAPPPPGRDDAVQTRADAIAQADARFDQMDADHDGVVTPDEMRAARLAMRDQAIARGDTPPPPPPADRGGRVGGMRHGGGDGPRRMTMTKAQFEERAAARFDRMDTNHDGRIDATERANMAEMRHVDRQERRGSADRPETPPPPPPGG